MLKKTLALCSLLLVGNNAETSNFQEPLINTSLISSAANYDLEVRFLFLSGEGSARWQVNESEESLESNFQIYPLTDGLFGIDSRFSIVSLHDLTSDGNFQLTHYNLSFWQEERSLEVLLNEDNEIISDCRSLPSANEINCRNIPTHLNYPDLFLALYQLTEENLDSSLEKNIFYDGINHSITFNREGTERVNGNRCSVYQAEVDFLGSHADQLYVWLNSEESFPERIRLVLDNGAYVTLTKN